MKREAFSGWVGNVVVRRAGAWLALLVVALGASCSDRTEDSSEVIGSVEQSVVQARSLTFSLLAGTRADDFTVGAVNTVDVRDRVKITGNTLTTTSGLSVGNDARVGNISAKGNVSVGDRSRVTGNVKAGGTLTISPSATVTGTRQSGVSFAPLSTTTLKFQAESVSAGPISVGTDQALDVSPGTYTSLSIHSRSTVTLHTGVYLFKGAITLEPQAVLAIDSRNGPVQVYFEGNLTFRGAIRSATVGVPQLLMGKLGSGTVTIERSFLGALIAPSADVALQSALPDGHSAVIYGKTVRLEPDTIVRKYTFDWAGIDPELPSPPIPPDTPIVQMPPSFDLPVDVDDTGEGQPTATARAEPPLTFAMPPFYPITGGYIGTGGLTFTFHVPGGGTVTCTYKGGATTATPTTPEEFNKGRMLHFQGCSDGLPPGATRTGDDFTVAVDAVDGYPVSVRAPIIKDGGCSEDLSLLTPEQTMQMRTSFTWTGKAPVQATNSDGSPALYYAWLLLRTKDDALNARKLFIHMLNRPLFDQELSAFAGRCGTFSNPGDGFGAFVPVVIPGATYNRLLQALSDPSITQGDRTIFDAIILRNDEVPAAARNANGSLRIDVLGASGFRYLDYEPRPLNSNAIQLDGGHTTRAVLGALQFVVGAAQEAAQLATTVLGAIDRFVRGKITVNLHVHAADLDPAFRTTPPSAMVRGWGTRRGRPLGAPGLEVIIMQKFLDTPIPSTSRGLTNDEGFTVIEAVDGGDTRGSGVCIEHSNDAAKITDFLTAAQTCDFRSYSTDTPRRLNLNDSGTTVLRAGSAGVVAHYQMDDVYQWANKVAGVKVPRARVLTGFWASTFARTDPNALDEKIPYAPCLNLAGGISDEALLGAQSVGILAQLISPTLPPVAIGVIVDSFVSVMTHSDIVMPTNSNIAVSRGVMSHEYGHYLLCSMLDSQDDAPGGVQHIVKATIASNGDFRTSVRSFNEAFADYIEGQVAGGVTHTFLRRAFKKPGAYHYCSDYFHPADPQNSSRPCLDDNLRGTANSATSHASVGRFVTLLQDLFDGQLVNGQPAPLGQNLPGDGDLWEQVNADGTPRDANFADDRLVPFRINATPPVFSYGNGWDNGNDNVALPGPDLNDGLVSWLATRIFSEGTFTNEMVYSAAAISMATRNVNWCDACRVLAVHSPELAQTAELIDPSVPELFAECIKPNGVIQRALLPLSLSLPEPNGNIDAATCTPCPAGQVTDPAGTCMPCQGTVQGNRCIQCPADVMIDGGTVELGTAFEFDPSVALAGDTCPELFWVQVNRPDLVFARGRTAIAGRAQPMSPATQATCTQPFALQFTKATGGTFGAAQLFNATGQWSCPLSCSCDALPQRSVVASEVTTEPIRFGMPAGDPNKRLSLVFVDGITL